MELLKIIAKLLNISEDKAKEFVDKEDEDGLIDLNKANLDKRFDDGHKKASKLSTKKLVDALKSELDVEIKGESPEEIAESFKEAIENRSADDISEEQIKASDTYKDLLTQFNKKEGEINKIVDKKVKEAVKEKEKEFADGLKRAKRQAIDSELELEAEKWLVENNAILSTDPAKRKKQIKELAVKLASDEVEKDSDGSYLISKADGTPYTNKDGHNATLADRFSEFDYLFNFQEVQQRQSSGLPPAGPGRSGGVEFKHFKGDVPKDEAGLNDLRIKRVNREISAEAYQEAETAYKANQTA